jgi:alpha-1,3-rhamnosyl/mannosyltransferase
VVGLSSNVVDASLSRGGLDGIGIYTLALERALQRAGVTTRRIGAPVLSRRGIRVPRHADLRLRAPLVASIVWSALTGRPAPFTGPVERPIDVYHCTDYRVPKLRRTPVVATLYDAIPLMRPEWANPRLRRAKNWLMRTAARNADRIIAISSAAAGEIGEHYDIDRARIRVVPLGVDPEWLEEPPEHAIESCRTLALERDYLLFVGTLQPRKNIAALIDAYDRLPRAQRDAHQLVIVGKYGWGVEALRTELERRRPQKRVLWLEYVERDVLRAIYRSARAFVFPSLAEGFGLPVLEALASGLPVVATDIASTREVAGGHALLVTPGDRDALSAAMARVLDAPRSEDADRGRRDWARTFDWDACARGTLAVYRELVDA